MTILTNPVFLWAAGTVLYIILGCLMGCFLHYRVGGEFHLDRSPLAVFLGGVWPAVLPVAIGVGLGKALFAKGR